MKKLLTIFMIVFIGLTGLIFGCDGRYDDLTISITTEQARAADGSITLYVGGTSEEITVTMGGAPKGFNYVPSFSFSNPEIISINSANNMVKKGVKKTLTALAPGSTIMTVRTSEGGKTASLNINIIKKASAISFKESFSLAVTRKTGASVKIDYNTALSIEPKDSNQTFIKYELKNPSSDISIDQDTGVLTIINGNTALEYVEVLARLVDHVGNPEPGIPAAEARVYIIDEILPENINLYKGNVLEDVVDANLIVDPITLAKNVDTLNTVEVILTVKTRHNITIVTPPFTTSSPVMVNEDISKRKIINGSQQFYFRVSAIRYNLDYKLRFGIELTGFEGQFDYYKELPLICDLYAKDFEINNVVLNKGVAHQLPLYTNDLSNGTEMLVAVSNPREVSDQNGKFTVTLFDGETKIDTQDLVNKYFEIRANGPIDIVGTEFSNNTQFFIKIKDDQVKVADSGRFKLYIEAVNPNTTNLDLKAYTTVTLLVKQGIESIDKVTYVENGETKKSGFGEASSVKINIDAVPALDIGFELTPPTADPSTIVVRSADEDIVKVEKVGTAFRLIPASVGKVRVFVTSTTLDAEKYFNVDVYKPISDFFVGVDLNSQENHLGDKVISNNSIEQMIVKNEREINLIYTTNPINAQYYEISYEITKVIGGETPTEVELEEIEGVFEDGNLTFTVATNSFNFLTQTEENVSYVIKVIMTNYDGDTIEKTFSVKAYIPIKSIDFTLKQKELYNPKKLGWFDLYGANVQYTSITKNFSCDPVNATFNGTEKFSVRVDGKLENSDILLYDGTTFRINPDYEIDKFPKRISIVVEIKEYSKTLTASRDVIIRDPVTVESLMVDGAVNNMLYFKEGITQPATLKITTQPSTGVFNNKVKWVLLAEGSDTILDFADNSYNNRPIINKENAIVSVAQNPNQPNTYTISPVAGKVGNARLIIIPEDKIKDFKDNRYIYDWKGVVEIFISVADGSEAYPYQVASYEDLIEVNEAPDKFYVLVNDIHVTQEWTPLSEHEEFTGGINGKYSRLIDAENNIYYYKQYKITGLSYVNNSYDGLNYGFVAVNGGKLRNLDLTYEYIQGQFNGNIGGVAGTNRGIITDCKVNYVRTDITAYYSINFGGIAGTNESGVIEGSGTIENSITQTVTGNIKISICDQTSALYVGGLVGTTTKATITRGSLLNIGEDANPEINYGDAGYDLTVNITVLNPAEENKDDTFVCGIGGVLGVILDTENATSINISNICVQGTINAPNFRNVGGFVGSVVNANITNCFSTVKITAHEVVGGFAGSLDRANIVYSSAENYNDSETRIRTYITADNYIGGFAAKAISSTINYCYAVSYFEGVDLPDIICKGPVATSKFIGGFLADVVECEISYCASVMNITASGENRNTIGGFIGVLRETPSTVDNVYCRGFGMVNGIPIDMLGIASDSIGGDKTYYSTYNFDSSLLDPDNPLGTTGVTSSGTFEDVGVEGDPGYVKKFWAVDPNSNNGLPYIVRPDGQILFANLPLQVEVTVNNNIPDVGVEEEVNQTKQDGFVYVDDQNVIIFYNTIDDGSLDMQQLINVNTYSLDKFAQTTVTPLTQKTARVTITSSDPSVIRVNSNGTIHVVAPGNVKLTVSSKLNSQFNKSIYVIVKHGINDFNLYENSNLTSASKVNPNNAYPIKTLVNGQYPLYNKVEYDRVLNGETYSLQTAGETNIRYILEDPNDREFLTINSDWVAYSDGVNSYYYVDIPYNVLAVILPKQKADRLISITAVPYLSITHTSDHGVSNQKVLLNYLAKKFYIDIKNGATNIYFESNLVQVEITQLQTLIMTVVIETDSLEDGITYFQKESLDLDVYSDISMLSINNTSNEPVRDEHDNLVAIKSKYSIAYPYNPNKTEEENLLSGELKFQISFKSTQVKTIRKDFELTVVPQSIVSVDTRVYSNYGDYLNKDGVDQYIFNGVTALLTVEVYPYFSRFDRFEVLYSSSQNYEISLTQLKFDRNRVEFSATGAKGVKDALFDYPNSGSEYIKGYGIKINKATGESSLIGSDDGIYSYSKLYYISMLIGSEIPDLTKFDLELKFFKDHEQVQPFGSKLTLHSLSQPYVDIELADTSLNNTVPVGTNNKLNVEVRNFVGDIDWEVSIVNNGAAEVCDKASGTCYCAACLNDNYALVQSLKPVLIDGEYYINVPSKSDDDESNLIVGAYESLLGKTLKIKATVTKTDNSNAGGGAAAGGTGEFTYSDELELLVTLFTVKSVTVDGASTGVLRLPIYSPYALRLSVDAYYGNQDTEITLNSITYKISNLVSKLQNELSKNEIWYYFNTTVADGGYEQLKVGDIKYNSIFNFTTYDSYFAVYGYEVNTVTDVKAMLNIGYGDGLPQISLTGAEGLQNICGYEHEFSLVFDYQADIKNPIPIQTAEELYAMEEGLDYRLVNDIHLTDHTPITTNIKSLDGNGYTIYITGHKSYIPSTENQEKLKANIGLFDTVNEGSMIYNLDVCYVKEVLDRSGINAAGNYVADISLLNQINPLEINATGLSEMNFGGIAGINEGIITNCKVYGNLKINADNLILTDGYTGSIAGINNGYITNSVAGYDLVSNGKIIGFEISSYGSVGGFVGQNNKLISTSYVNNIKVINRSDDVDKFFTGGFVVVNSKDSRIVKCYSEGRKNDSDVNIVYTAGGVQTKGIAGGFVYQNEGDIQDCYSNILLTASTGSAGFVYVNGNQASVNNCYSISKIPSLLTQSPFTGLGKDGGMVVEYSGTITNCYYLNGGYHDFDNEPAQKISVDDFATTATFATYDIAIDANSVDHAEGRTWIIKGGKPVLVNTQIRTYSNKAYIGKDKIYGASITFNFDDETSRWVQSDANYNYITLSREATSVAFEQSEQLFYLKPTEVTKVNNITGVKTYFTYWTYESTKYIIKAEPTGTEGLYNYKLSPIEIDDSIELGYRELGGIEREPIFGNYTELYDVTGGWTGRWQEVGSTNGYNVFYDETNGYYFDRSGQKEFINIKIVGANYYVDGETKSVDLSLDRFGKCELEYVQTADGKGSLSYAMIENVQYYYSSVGHIAKDGTQSYKIGSKTNPYIIYDVESFNYYIEDKSTFTDLQLPEEREYYRFVSDIDFAFKTPITSTRTVIGYLDGNNMTLSNIVITYDSGQITKDSFGLFAELRNSIVVDLHLKINEVVSSAHTYVGGLAGRAYANITGYNVGKSETQSKPYIDFTIINHVTVEATDDNSVVLGRNIVGGLIGYATGNVRVNDVTASINSNSVFVMFTEAGVKHLLYQRLTSDAQLTNELKALTGQSSVADFNNYINKNISYAGAVIGILDAMAIDEKTTNLGYTYHVNNLTLNKKFKVAARIVGGAFGLVAKDNQVHDVTIILNSENQSVRGDFISGGLIGENRGIISNITMVYNEEIQKQLEKDRIGVLNNQRNLDYFNNQAKTTTIGGIIGFNNNGSLENAISHLDVRNTNAKVAGGAIGRTVGGVFKNVITTGSVRAKTIVGGMVGSVNSSGMLLYSDGFVYLDQYTVLPQDGTVENRVLNTKTTPTLLPSFISCIAANNWTVSDHGYITPRDSTHRITGGFVGLESLRTDYSLNRFVYDAETNEQSENEAYNILGTSLGTCFTNCYYTYSAYSANNPSATTIPTYIAPLYLSNFDQPYVTVDARDDDLKPRKQIPQVNGILGLTHFEMLYSKDVTYTGAKLLSATTSGAIFEVTIAGLSEETVNGLDYQNNILRDFGYKTHSISYEGEAENKVYTVKLVYTIPADLLSIDGSTLFTAKSKGEGAGMTFDLSVSYKTTLYQNFSLDIWNFGDKFYSKNLADADRYPTIKKYAKTFRWEEFIEDMQPEYDNHYLQKDGNVFLINNAEDLAKMSRAVNNNIEHNGVKYREAKYRLTANIDMSGKYWTPIGLTEATAFDGEFDGNGFAINYATVGSKSTQTNATLTAAGIFAYGTEDSIIKNLTAEGGSITGVIAGGIIGYTQGDIFNCSNKNAVNGTAFAGGVVGFSTGNIKEARNQGVITLNTTGITSLTSEQTTFVAALPFVSANTNAVGGIAGFVYEVELNGDSSNSGAINAVDKLTDYLNSKKYSLYVGGLFGYISNITDITSSSITSENKNLAKITVESNADALYVGGFVGTFVAGHLNYLEETEGVYVANAKMKFFNNGEILVNYTNANSEVDSTNRYNQAYTAHFAVGGVVGLSNNNIANSSNNGKITFNTAYTSFSVGGVGGIAGRINEDVTIEQCYNANTVQTNINNTVTICGSSGIVGIAQKASNKESENTSIVDASTINTITNCYNMGQISGSGNGFNFLGGITGLALTHIGGVNVYFIQYNLLESSAYPADEQLTNISVLKIQSTYNTGTIKNTSENVFGWGSIVGYNGFISYGSEPVSADTANFYLKGTSDNAGFAYKKEGKEQVDILTNLGNRVEQRTANNLKKIFATNTAWNQLVDTWYPTLKDNYLILNWRDYTSEFESVASNTFAISTAEQLAYLSKAVNSGSISTQNLTITLKDNIDMSNRYFEPIGTEEYPFRGTFNGGDYSIKYLTINPSTAIDGKIGALFGYVEDATITKVGLVSPTITDLEQAASLIYKATSSEISYCYNEIDAVEEGGSTTYKTGSISATERVAGLVLDLVDSKLSRSYNNVPLYLVAKQGEVDATGKMAGLVLSLTRSQIYDSYQDNGVGYNVGLHVYTSQASPAEGSVDGIALELDKESALFRVYNIAQVTVHYNTQQNNVSGYNAVISNRIWVESSRQEESPENSGNYVTIDTSKHISYPSNYTSIIPQVSVVEELKDNLGNLVWDMTNIWGSEYTLNTSGKDNVTLRKLGKNWINTECEDLELSNAAGKGISAKTEEEAVEDFEYYDITNAKQLAWVAKNINMGLLTGLKSDGTGYTFRLRNDIDLSGRYWTPIGNLDNPFRAIFDFANYTITGLVIDSETVMYAGLFGYAQNAVIRNGYMDNAYIKVDATQQTYEEASALNSMYMGAVVAKAHNTAINNITVAANLTGYSKYNIFMGGLSGALSFSRAGISNIGEADGVKIENIVINQPKNADGTVKYALIPTEYRGTAGAGASDPGLDEIAETNVNIGAFSSSGYTYVGGITGRMSGAYTAVSPTEAIIEYSSNNANVVSYSSKNTSYSYGGGIVGYLLENGTIRNVQNNGKIKTFTMGYDYAGGMVGMLESSKVLNAYNTAYVECSQYVSSLSYTGGIAGYTRTGGSIEYSVSKGNTIKNIDSTQILTGGVVGYVLKDEDGSTPKLNYNIYLKTDGFEVGYNGDAPTTVDPDLATSGFDRASFNDANSDFNAAFANLTNYSVEWGVTGETVRLQTERLFKIYMATGADVNIKFYIYNRAQSAIGSETGGQDVPRGNYFVVSYSGEIPSGKAIQFTMNGRVVTLEECGYVDGNQFKIASDPYQASAFWFRMPSNDVSITYQFVDA